MNEMKRLAALTILPMAACSALTEFGPGTRLTVQIGSEFELFANDGATIHSYPDTPEDLWVWFVGVTSDSRCPTQFRCVVPGNAEVVVETAAAIDGDLGEVRTHTLHTSIAPGGISGPDSVTVGPFLFRIVKLEPYPERHDSIDPDDYSTTFEVHLLDKQ